MRSYVLAAVTAAGLTSALLAAPASAKTTTDKVTSGSWGQGVAVVDPNVPANDTTPSDYAAIKLKVTLTLANGSLGLSWDNGPDNVIGGCGAPNCLPSVMPPGVYRFPFVAGSGGMVAGVGGHFNLTWHDARGKAHTLSVPIQSDPGFAHLPSWATP